MIILFKYRVMWDWRARVLFLCHYLIQFSTWTACRATSSASSAIAASAGANGGVLANAPSDPLQPRVTPRRGYLIRVGQSLNLTCPYDVPFYSWTPSDEPANILSDNQVFRIRSAKLEDSRRYSCHAVDGYGKNSAEIAVRVIDPSSYVAQRECMLDANGVNPDGPCFLISYSDRDLNPKMSWGESIVFDCDVVTGNGNVDGLVYRWEVQYSRPIGTGSIGSTDLNRHRLLTRSSAMSLPSGNGPVPVVSPRGSVSSGAIPQAPMSPSSSDFVRFNEPKLRIDKLNLRHSGEYRCTVIDTRRSAAGLVSAGRSDTISRTFRLSVKPRAEGPIIRGPRITNETVIAGQDAVFKCEVNPEEHRSSTIRWGKSIDAAQRSTYENEGREVIQWAGGTFVVLPSVPNSAIPENELVANPTGQVSPDDMQSMTNVGDTGLRRRKVGRTASNLIPATGAVATEASPSQTSRLVLRRAKASDSGRYVCSVLTEAGRDDHKFVHVSVIGAAGSDTSGVPGSGVRRLTVYIAVPTAVFLICLCVVTYCLVSRRASRGSRSAHRRQRNYYGPTQQSHIKSPSAASSSSIGVSRNGVGVNPGGWNTSGDPRLRPSPAGTGPGTGTLGYSSTNGSNSVTGPGQVLVSTQPYQTALPGSVPMVPGSYPLLMQSMGSQPNAPYYAVQDPNGMSAVYPQSIYPVSSAGGNEYILTSNAMNVYPQGMIYPMANGHASSQNSANLMPNSALNSSSPESSAITGPTDTGDGRLLYQPSSQGPGPVFPVFQGPGTTCAGGTIGGPGCGTNLTYHQPNQADMDINLNNTPLLSYQSHPDTSNTLRA